MQDKAIRVINEGAAKVVSNTSFIKHEIMRTKSSKEWKWMIAGDDYYIGKHDILKKKRTAIGEDGELTEVKNLPNSKAIDNVYKRMVKQKNNYLLGKPFTVTTDDDTYNDALSWFFDKKFMRNMKNIGKDSLNCGIAWLYVHYDEKGDLCFKRFRPYEIIPEWKDVDHTELDAVIRFYEISSWDGTVEKKITKVEYYTEAGIDFYEYYNNDLVPAAPYHQDYMTVDGKSYNWDRLPFVAFKYNQEEIPLLVNCKSLQDGLNQIISAFEDNMEEDSRNTILVLVNYDGENLGEFRKNLATYGAVKIKTVDGAAGDLKTLQVEVNADNYKAIIDIFKKAIVENCMGFDAKDEKLSGNPNQMNIRSMYNDIDLDASDMEIEYQAAMEDVLWFIDFHLMNTGVGNFADQDVTITFNTNLPMDETTTIENIQRSVGILSDETLLANHPWVDDPQEELEKVKAQKQENMEEYGLAFNPAVPDPDDEGDTEE